VIGFLVVDKPRGLTSHDVVAKARRGTHIKRIGHAGTLDPMATGVLVLCLDEATRLVEYVTASEKEYVATLHLGIETDTYDADGQPVRDQDSTGVTRESFIAALDPFRGAIRQVPPMYSALKQNGVRLYELARAGQEVTREARPVTISTLELIDWSPPAAAIRVVCGAGTYIRSLAHDIGEVLAVGAHLTALRRTRSGAADSPIAWDQLLAAFEDGTWQSLMSDEHALLAGLSTVTLEPAQTDRWLHGQSVTIEHDASVPEQQPIRLYDMSGRLVGVGERIADRLKPIKVFLPSSAS
jgi:tRNA pseudouridine55 synthase